MTIPLKKIGFRSLTTSVRGFRIEQRIGGLTNLLAEVFVSDPVPASKCEEYANLFVAAPELLEAAQHMFEWLANHFEDFDSDTNAQALCLSNEIEAAVAKAEGRV